VFFHRLALVPEQSRMIRPVFQTSTASAADVLKETRYWSISAESLIELLDSRLSGLTDEQASERIAEFGANRLQTKRRVRPWQLLFSQFKSPIIMILISAAVPSLFLQDATDALIILAIVIASGLLGFWQEHSAANAVSKLRSIVEVKARVLRDAVEKVVPV
jgi:Mg2+-importing ATPase